MKLSSFTAENANEAVRLVQASLGADAVIVSVRKLPGNGFARLLQRGKIEVTAGVPETATATRQVTSPETNSYSPFEEIAEEETPVTLQLLERAALALGRKLKVELA